MCEKDKLLADLREQISDTDSQIAALFSRRMELSAKVAQIKKENSIPIFDPEREQIVIDSAIARMGESCRKYYPPVITAILTASKEYQKDIIGEDNE